jgi:hypothetical protein
MRTIFILLCCGVLLLATGALATQVAVHYQEGVTNGYLILRETNGRLIADGENSQTASGSTVRSRLTFHFKDGSLYDDTTVYTDHGVFRLVTDHAIQKGPSFKSQQETYIDASTGEVSVKYIDKGKQKFIGQRMKLPADVSNGLLYIIAKNIMPSPATTVSYLAFTPNPRLVKLVFSRVGEQKFFTDATSHNAIRYVMKVEIGGITGVVASVFGKVPPDTQFWMLDSTPPSFAGSQGPLYGEGPVWRIDLVSPRRPADHPLRQNASTGRNSGH